MAKAVVQDVETVVRLPCEPQYEGTGYKFLILILIAGDYS
jgi:hypothetical protein